MTQNATASLPSTDSAPMDSARGVVFTKPWVVDLILDLSGYTADLDLCAQTAIEPAVGHGAFLIAMTRRLAASARTHGADLSQATEAIVGYDVDAGAVTKSRAAVEAVLRSEGLRPAAAAKLSKSWVRCDDFLLANHDGVCPGWVLGNPPYVRPEDLDRRLLSRYRQAWSAMTGRADLYVGFIQAGLKLLGDGGRLGVICPDRWMRNQYGAALRSIVEADYSVDACVVMHEVSAFEDKVSAYPAITVLRRAEQGAALICEAGPTFDEASSRRLLSVWRQGPELTDDENEAGISWTTGWFKGPQSWPDADPSRLGLLAQLESSFPTLEATGVHLSVGVATGADDIYITDTPSSIEPARLVKILSARETATGAIQWAGRYLVNPWDQTGLVSLTEWPGLASYLHRHRTRLKARHVARSHPGQWWRTIDRVHPELTTTPKLLIPDLKDRIFPVLDRGEYYPGHSLYYLTSRTWDLEVLGGLLMSDIAATFVEAYSVRMANGYMRVSAQYLRRVRVPEPSSLGSKMSANLRAAFRTRDTKAANALARVAYAV